MGIADIAQGALGGGLGGAGLGGPWGGLVGAGLGALGGMFGGNQQDEYRRRLEAEMSGMRAPQMGPAAQGQNSFFRQNQANLIGRLEALASGQGPSLAQAQLDAATERNQRGQQAFAAGARGPNAAMAQFQAANNMAGLGAQAAQDATAARIAEQQMALQQLGLTIHGARGSDEDMSRFNAGQRNDVGLANMNSQQNNNQLRMQLLQMLGGMSGGPTLGEQLLAGGASMYQFGTAQRAQQRAAGQRT